MKLTQYFDNLKRRVAGEIDPFSLISVNVPVRMEERRKTYSEALRGLKRDMA